MTPPCTPERAGLEAATELSFSYYHPPEGCVLDPIGRAGSCNVGGCTVRDRLSLLGEESALAELLGCPDPSVSSGVDFSTRRVVFVRQGTRVGEAMGVEPIGFVAEAGAVVTFGENRRSFCTGGQPLTGGVVSYAFTIPIPTSSTATVARHICFRRVPCDCTEEESCGG